MEVKQEIVETINRQKIEKYTIINDNGGSNLARIFSAR